jgi:Holliday junction resolvasome RuvABC DNA-binding subunit
MAQEKIERESQLLMELDDALRSLLALGWNEDDLIERVEQAAEEHAREEDEEEEEEEDADEPGGV